MKNLPYVDPVESCFACPEADSGLFCRLGPRILTDLDAMRQATVYPKGAVLFAAGQAPRGVFVLCRGRAKLTVASKRGHSVILGFVGTGEVLGLAAVLANTPYEVTAEIVQTAQANFIPRTRLLQLLGEHPDAKTRAAEYLSLEVRRARRQAARLALARTVRSRLAALLLELAGTGRRDARGLQFQLGLTHEELAALIGTSRETVTRLLADFRREGLLHTRKGLIVLPDPSKLDTL